MKAILGIIAFLSIVIVVLVFFFVRQSIILRREQVLSARELWISNLLKQHGSPTQSDVVFIRPWMTFDYVNQLFKLPPGYLEAHLSITDSGYPHVTLSSYAQHNNLNTNAFLSSVDDAIVQYLTPAASSTTRG